MAKKERVIGYVISEDNKFVDWMYPSSSIYYLAKKVEIYDNMSGETIKYKYEPLADKYAYKDHKVEEFRGLKVIDIKEDSLNVY